MGPETEKGERPSEAVGEGHDDDRREEAGRAAAPPDGGGDEEFPRLVAPGQGGSRQELDDAVERAGGASTAGRPGRGEGEVEEDLDDLKP
jgi:hypothetical protein